MRNLLVLFLGLCASVVSIDIASAQEEYRIDRYTKLAKPLGSIELTFPGPGGGYAFANLDVQYVDGYDDTTYRKMKFLIDFTVSSDGTFIPPDTMRSTDQYKEHVIRLSDERFVRATLSKSESKIEYRDLDSTFAGVLGYFFFKRYISVFDFKRNKLTLYPHFASINIRPSDTNAIQVQYKDDAFITYCNCPFPSVWLESEAPPLKKGRVFFGFGSPYSEVYTTALDEQTRKIVEKETEVDSLTGRKNPKRLVRELPPLFKDLSVQVMGSMGTDVLRTFSAMIFDPSREQVTLVK
jgi:hypothetical protein